MRKDIREGVRFYIMNDIKPNFAQMARQYDSDPRTIKKHFEEQQNPELIKPRKPVPEKASKLDPYRTLIDEKVSEGCSRYGDLFGLSTLFRTKIIRCQK